MAEPKEWGKKVTVRMPEALLERIKHCGKNREDWYKNGGVSKTIRDCVVAGIDVIDEGKFKLKKEKKRKTKR